MKAVSYWSKKLFDARLIELKSKPASKGRNKKIRGVYNSKSNYWYFYNLISQLNSDVDLVLEDLMIKPDTIVLGAYIVQYLSSMFPEEYKLLYQQLEEKIYLKNYDLVLLLD